MMTTTSRRPLTVRCLVRDATRRAGEFHDRVGLLYQRALDLGERREVQSLSVDEQIQWRETLLRNIHRIIKDSVDSDGMTPSERKNEAYVRNTEEEAELRRVLSTVLILGDSEPEPEEWLEAQEKDLNLNFLYHEYMGQLFASPYPMAFADYCNYVAARAVIFLVTRTQYARKIVDELVPDGHAKPNQADIERFLVMGYHQEKDPYRYLALFNTEIPGGQNLSQAFLNRYAEMVQKTWDKRRSNSKTPLPGEKDWLIIDGEEDPLELAIEAYQNGRSINQAAREFGVGNRRLIKALDARGIKRGGSNV